MLRITTGTQDQILSVNVVSFGFKYGIPADADLVLDVRFLPNPYYVPALRPKNGTDPQVRAYVFRDGTADDYMEKLCDMLDFLIPQYQREGKAVLTIAVGCTGGRHRSVAVAQALAEHVQHCGIPIAAVGSAIPATFRFVFKTFFMIKFLFSRSKNELITSILTYQNSVFKHVQ